MQFRAFEKCGERAWRPGRNQLVARRLEVWQGIDIFAGIDKPRNEDHNVMSELIVYGVEMYWGVRGPRDRLEAISYVSLCQNHESGAWKSR